MSDIWLFCLSICSLSGVPFQTSRDMGLCFQLGTQALWGDGVFMSFYTLTNTHRYRPRYHKWQRRFRPKIRQRMTLEIWQHVESCLSVVARKRNRINQLRNKLRANPSWQQGCSFTRRLSARIHSHHKRSTCGELTLVREVWGYTQTTGTEARSVLYSPAHT